MAEKPLKVTERKLGRHMAVGLAWTEDNHIEIDPRQASKEYLGTLIHEHLHILFPSWSEKEVSRVEKKLCNLIWKQGFRKIQK